MQKGKIGSNPIRQVNCLLNWEISPFVWLGAKAYGLWKKKPIGCFLYIFLGST